MILVISLGSKMFQKIGIIFYRAMTKKKVIAVKLC
jgi:hypothetical protein